MTEYWFRCPKCGLLGTIDEDQAHGRVSIQCVTLDCDFHETGTVSLLIPDTVAIKLEQAPTFESVKNDN